MIEGFPLFGPELHVFLDPLVLEEESLVSCLARVDLALEDEVSDLDALTTELFRGGPGVHLNERLLLTSLHKGVEVLLHPAIPGVLPVIGEDVLLSLVLQLVWETEARINLSKVDNLGVEVVARVVQRWEDDGGGVGDWAALDQLFLDTVSFACTLETFNSALEGPVEEVPTLLAFLVFTSEAGHGEEVS